MSDEPRNGDSHYFDEDPGRKQVTREFGLDARGRRLVLDASSGVFSSTGLDKGTAVLIDWLEGNFPPLRRDSVVVDVGCGAGPIALWFAASNPATRVVAVDVNRRALDVCRRNAERNSLGNVTCLAPNDADDLRNVDVIVSNPPIRIGKVALHELVSTWLARLKPEGICLLVVARNLGSDSLARWLESRGFIVTRVESRKGFRVLQVRPSQPQ